MGKLAEKRVSIAKHILETKDEALLNTMEELVHDRLFTLTAADKRELDAIRARHLAGDGQSSPWPEVKKRINRLIEKKAKR
jgi:hypothetical protein